MQENSQDDKNNKFRDDCLLSLYSVHPFVRSVRTSENLSGN